MGGTVQLLLASILWIGSVAQPTAPVSLTALTVPLTELPPGCRLAPAATMRLDGTRVQGGLWGGLSIESNPLTGKDRPLLATIRERTGPPTAMPDAGPLTRGEAARFRLMRAEGVEEGYAAVYLQADTDVIAVYALTLANGETIERPPRGTVHVDLGFTNAYLSGNDGPCFQAILAHVQSFAR